MSKFMCRVGTLRDGSRVLILPTKILEVVNLETGETI
jgi:hypothetical protein